MSTPVIECIEALKVFDNCSDIVNVSGLCAPIPKSCKLPTSFAVECAVVSAECVGPLAVMPHVPADGLANVTFGINFTLAIAILDTGNHPPTIACEFTVTESITETVSLVAPPGFDMIYQCAVTAFTCGPCIVATFGATPVEQSVCCEVEFCLEIQSKYPVKIEVLTTGYCAQVPCRLKQGPTLICPPTPFYPPQP